MGIDTQNSLSLLRVIKSIGGHIGTGDCDKYDLLNYLPRRGSPSSFGQTGTPETGIHLREKLAQQGCRQDFSLGNNVD